MSARDVEAAAISACDGVSVDKEGAPDVEEEEKLPPQRLTLVVMICVIQGYTLIGPLQHAFKVRMNIGDTGDVAHIFTQAAALVQWGKFAMTLGQNVILCWCSPLARVYLAMSAMMIGCIIPPLFVYLLGSTWLGWVFLSFGFLGLGLGVFECTFLNVITPLGPLTKSWAIMGFPAAFAIINVFGMTLVSFGLPVQALFWYIVCCMPVGILVFATRIAPQLARQVVTSAGKSAEHGKKQVEVWNSIKDWSSWLPRMLPFMLANIVGHFVMEGALPANFNTFNDFGHGTPLFGRMDTHLMNTSRFFVVFFVFVGLGDMISRRVGYCFRLDSYASNFAALLGGLLCSALGMYLTTLGVGVVSWASAFLAFWGQGFNYAVSSKYIDRFVPRQHNLAAYSFWMFAGGAGAIAGSTMVDVIRGWICHGQSYPHECLVLHHHR